MSRENEPRGRNKPRQQQPPLDTAPYQADFWGLLQDLLKAAQGYTRLVHRPALPMELLGWSWVGKF